MFKLSHDISISFIPESWYSSIGNSERLIEEVLHLRTELYHQWLAFSRRPLVCSRELVRRVTVCVHRHCKKQNISLITGSTAVCEHPAIISDRVERYVDTLLARLLRTVLAIPDHLPSLLFITLLRNKILQQFPSSRVRNNIKNSSSKVPRTNSSKQLKEFNKIRPKNCAQV